MVEFGCCIGGISLYICLGVLSFFRNVSVELAVAYLDILERHDLRVEDEIGFQCHCLAEIVSLRCLCSLHISIIWGTVAAGDAHSKHQTRIALWFHLPPCMW
jgi:hypothetical protein